VIIKENCMHLIPTNQSSKRANTQFINYLLLNALILRRNVHPAQTTLSQRNRSLANFCLPGRDSFRLQICGAQWLYASLVKRKGWGSCLNTLLSGWQQQNPVAQSSKAF
jgi:hypothetical protein